MLGVLGGVALHFGRRLLGLHLAGALVKRIAGGAGSGWELPIAKDTLEAGVAIAQGLGARFFLGAGVAAYLSNEGFRAGIDQAVKALLP